MLLKGQTPFVNAYAAAVLDLACKRPVEAGVYTLTLDPSKLDLLAAGAPEGCGGHWALYDARTENGEVRLQRHQHEPPAAIPQALSDRMSAEHASVVQYVFEERDGWLVTCDASEFGGGIEWYARSGGPPRSVANGQNDHDHAPQNVNRALAVAGVVHVLQGLSHGISAGHFAALWRARSSRRGRSRGSARSRWIGCFSPAGRGGC